MTFEELNKFVNACHQNAKDMITAAKFLIDKDVDHVCYHLSALALEETGKAVILKVQYLVDKGNTSSLYFNPTIDDHTKKLFWALWGMAFVTGNHSVKSFNENKGLANKIHNDRLNCLYFDPNDPKLPKHKISHSEAVALLSMADAKLNFETNGEIIDLDEDRVNNLKWFLKTTDDPRKRGYIFSSGSLDKLVEYSDGDKWISWLKRKFELDEIEMQKILQEEQNQNSNLADDRNTPKWQVRTSIYSVSHLSSQKFINKWKKTSTVFNLEKSSKDRRELRCKFTIPKSITVDRLWKVIEEIGEVIVITLNIGTGGFFWWDLPKDIGNFYEIIEIEKNLAYHLSADPKIIGAWESKVLQEEDVDIIKLIMRYLAVIREKDAQIAINHYRLGLSLISKTGIDLRFDYQAFEQFFISFKAAFFINGDWKSNEDFKEAVRKQLTDQIISDEELSRLIKLGNELTIAGTTEEIISLTDVIDMKNCCDAYFTILAAKDLRDNITKEKNSSN